MAQTPDAAAVHPAIARDDHHSLMEYAVKQALLCPPARTKFRVGAVLVDAHTSRIISTGYSTELPGPIGDGGSTHAEQCCFIKVALAHELPAAHAERHIRHVLPARTVLYTTMEPCSSRRGGSTACVERILNLRDVIRAVYVGIRQPGPSCHCDDGMRRLQEAGIEVRITEDMKEQGVSRFSFLDSHGAVPPRPNHVSRASEDYASLAWLLCAEPRMPLGSGALGRLHDRRPCAPSEAAEERAPEWAQGTRVMAVVSWLKRDALSFPPCNAGLGAGMMSPSVEMQEKTRGLREGREHRTTGKTATWEDGRRSTRKMPLARLTTEVGPRPHTPRLLRM
ncbi:DRAP deaminase [Metarhizium album ARSEF 1941]|uniref:DRAP deaminase n=1 Tax=Metarhizium album (strain ARSEF 1941) TaxID=1081103 RepID=A0A0B2WNY0_METAS|nr:DRAP deaminase [Metarhizium album ARSEF 1941]KHN95359.1 DRAP deaminase [Metarhizium album ARSEF 1941]